MSMARGWEEGVPGLEHVPGYTELTGCADRYNVVVMLGGVVVVYGVFPRRTIISDNVKDGRK